MRVNFKIRRNDMLQEFWRCDLSCFASRGYSCEETLENSKHKILKNWVYLVHNLKKLLSSSSRLCSFLFHPVFVLFVASSFHPRNFIFHHTANAMFLWRKGGTNPIAKCGLGKTNQFVANGNPSFLNPAIQSQTWRVQWFNNGYIICIQTVNIVNTIGLLAAVWDTVFSSISKLMTTTPKARQ